MSKQKYYLTFALCCLSLCFEPLLLTNLTESARANPANKITVQKTKRFIGFKPPGVSQPNYTIGAATRNSGGICSRDLATPTRNLTALVSSADRAITTADRPTFLAYIPKTSARQASLIVKDASEQYFYRKNFALPEREGIVSVNLPKDAPALQAGKEYTWSIVLVCGQSLGPSDPFVSGKITRVKNTQLHGKLNRVSLRERVNFYQQNLIWYDTLATVAELKKLEPANAIATDTWQKLLQEVDLADLATQPLVRIK
jgi:hypothetical protein